MSAYLQIFVNTAYVLVGEPLSNRKPKISESASFASAISKPRIAFLP